MSQSPLPLTISVEDLKAARKEKSVHISSFAEQAEVSVQFVYAVEAGREKPSRKLLLAYASTCGFNSDDVLFSFGFVPHDLFHILQSCPSLREVLRSELSLQS